MGSCERQDHCSADQFCFSHSLLASRSLLGQPCLSHPSAFFLPVPVSGAPGSLGLCLGASETRRLFHSEHPTRIERQDHQFLNARLSASLRPNVTRFWDQSHGRSCHASDRKSHSSSSPPRLAARVPPDSSVTPLSTFDCSGH